MCCGTRRMRNDIVKRNELRKKTGGIGWAEAGQRYEAESLAAAEQLDCHINFIIQRN